MSTLTSKNLTSPCCKGTHSWRHPEKQPHTPAHFRGVRTAALILGRGLHSSTFRLNVSAFYRIGVACSGCLGGFQEVFGSIRGSLRYVICQKRLNMS
jgi:hypothetical protein